MCVVRTMRAQQMWGLSSPSADPRLTSEYKQEEERALVLRGLTAGLGSRGSIF